jgi:hypothetical protein
MELYTGESMRILSSGILAFTMNMMLASLASAEPCAAGSVHARREFSVPRNGVCLVKRAEDPGIKFLAFRLTVPPKLGQFGTASLYDFAYRAGNVAGDDYFEYTSINLVNGVKRDVRIRNVVHVLP